MAHAESLTSLGDRPLVIVTAQKEALGGWMAAQDELAALSTNSVHRILPDATHSMLTENEATAAKSRRQSWMSSTQSAPARISGRSDRSYSGLHEQLADQPHLGDIGHRSTPASLRS